VSKRYKKKLAPFVALFRHTIKTKAWRALSVGARATFLALKTNYNTNAQNAVFLSTRDGAKEFGASKNTVGKWLRELEHYGFIVAVRRAHLGVEGEGRATLYRLTDCPYAGSAPTYEFQNWDGVLYDRKKQNPVSKIGTPSPSHRDIRENWQIDQERNKRTNERDIRTDTGCPTERDITSLTSSRLNSESEEERGEWSTPTLTELPCSEYWAGDYQRLVAEAELDPIFLSRGRLNGGGYASLPASKPRNRPPGY
jgi:hypothetical protein